MALTVQDIVVFRKDKLFNGAVDTEWFYSDKNKSLIAAKNYVFHGPNSHAVLDDDVHSSHKLVDTATFTRNLLKKSYGDGEAAFSMVIAGYGSGKSHLALTLSHLLHDGPDDVSTAILSALEQADQAIADDIRELMAQDTRPALVVPINGMDSFNLLDGLTKRICSVLVQDKHDLAPIEALRPRFRNVAKMVKELTSYGNTAYSDELLKETGKPDIAAILNALALQDESTYKAAHAVLTSHGIPIDVSGVESIKILLDETIRSYCGEGKPYRSIVILFDEFGKYMEFSSAKPYLAGEGVLQSLFEGIQANSELINFVGFIQYELKSYAQRLAPTQLNDFQRYVTRFESAERSYLSTNMETLVANLIERKKGDECVSRSLMDEVAVAQAQKTILRIFPLSASTAAWADAKLFHNIIINRCWPLSPYAIWFIYYLSAAGKFLQERSVLNLLDEAFSALSDKPADSIPDFGFPAVTLWSASLKAELINAEASGLQGSSANTYAVIENKFAGKFSSAEIAVLRAIVIAAKTGMIAISKEDATASIALLAGLVQDLAETAISSLIQEYNVIQWDDAGKTFELIGDSAPRMQFLNILEQRARLYDQQNLDHLFNIKGLEYCAEFKDVDDTSFAEQNNISTPEWKFAASTASIHDLQAKLIAYTLEWSEVSHKSTAFDSAKGRIFYVYIGEDYNIDQQKIDIQNQLALIADQNKIYALPVLCVLIYDENGALGETIAKLDVIEKLSNEDMAKYGSLVASQKAKCIQEIDSLSRSCIRKRHYVCHLKNLDNTKLKLKDVCFEIFHDVYPIPLSFPLDGLKTAKGNGKVTCAMFMKNLLCGAINPLFMKTATSSDKNRCASLFKVAWDAMSNEGIAPYPKYNVLEGIFKNWDKILDKEPLSLSNAFAELVRPPFGANYASAQLAIGTFIAGRHEKLLVTVAGKAMTPSEWSQKVITTKTLAYPAWGDAVISLVGDTPDVWKRLMREWYSAQTYYDLCIFRDKAKELDASVPVPHQIYKEYHEKLEECKEAQKKLDDYDLRLEKAKKKIEIGEKLSLGEKSNCFHAFLSGASKLKTLHNDMEKESGKWNEAEFERINDEYNPAVSTVIDMFPNWINSMLPEKISLKDVSDFKEKMSEEIKRLRIIDLKELAAEAEKEEKTIILKVEHFAKISQEKAEMIQWAESVSAKVIDQTVIELKKIDELTKNYIKKAKLRAKDYPKHFNDILKKLEDASQDIETKKKELKNKVGDILQSTFSFPSEARQLIVEIDKTIPKFKDDDSSDSQSNIRDMKDMQKIARSCIDNYARLESFRGKKKDFYAIRDKIIDEVRQEIDDAELEWDAEEIYLSFSDKIAARHDTDFTSWLDRMKISAKQLQSMNTSEAERFRKSVLDTPEWGIEEHADSVETILNAIDSHLGEMEIEWIIARFNAMNDEMRSELIQRMLNLVKTDAVPDK